MKPGDELRIVRQVGVNDFAGNIAPQTRVVGAVDARHTTGGQELVDAVATGKHARLY